MHYAALYNNVKVAKILIKNGAIVNARQESSYTPLHYAALKGHTEMATLLVENGADKALTSNDNKLASTLAKDNGFNKLSIYLLDSNSTKKAALTASNTGNLHKKKSIP